MVSIFLPDEFAHLRPDTRVFDFGLRIDEPAASELAESISQITGVYRCTIQVIGDTCNFKAYAWKPSPDDEKRIRDAIDDEITRVMGKGAE